MSFHFRLLTVLGLLWAAPGWAAYETAASSAFVLDVGTGTVLFEKNPDVPLPPASMSRAWRKVMS